MDNVTPSQLQIERKCAVLASDVFRIEGFGFGEHGPRAEKFSAAINQVVVAAIIATPASAE